MKRESTANQMMTVNVAVSEGFFSQQYTGRSVDRLGDKNYCVFSHPLGRGQLGPLGCPSCRRPPQGAKSSPLPKGWYFQALLGGAMVRRYSPFFTCIFLLVSFIYVITSFSLIVHIPTPTLVSALATSVLGSFSPPSAANQNQNLP